MENYLKWVTFKGRVKAHVYPQLQFTSLFAPHLDSPGLTQHQDTAQSEKQSNKEQRKGNFSHHDKLIRGSTGTRLGVL